MARPMKCRRICEKPAYDCFGPEGIAPNEKVILTLDTSNESVYAQSSSGLDYILTSDGKPISVTEIYPTVRGVAIACTGGERDDIKIKVTELIGAYLGISSNRIKIVGID